MTDKGTLTEVRIGDLEEKIAALALDAEVILQDALSDLRLIVAEASDSWHPTYYEQIAAADMAVERARRLWIMLS